MDVLHQNAPSDLQIAEKRVQQPQVGIGTLQEMSMECIAARGNNQPDSRGSTKGVIAIRSIPNVVSAKEVV